MLIENQNEEEQIDSSKKVTSNSDFKVKSIEYEEVITETPVDQDEEINQQ